MTGTPLHDEYRRLDAASQAAGQRADVALKRQSGEAHSAAEREVLAELREWQDDADFKRRERGTPDEEDARQREITERVAAAVLDRGLAFAPTFGQIKGVMIVDPSIDREAREAVAEAQAARQAVKDFERRNADAMGEEQERAMQQDAAAAFRDGDIQSVRGILGLTDEAKERRSAALTTDDLPGRQRVTRGA